MNTIMKIEIGSKLMTFMALLLMLINSACKEEEPETIIVEKPRNIDRSFFPENTLYALNDLHQRSVDYFWNTSSTGGSDANSGMAGEGADRKNSLASGGTGFGVMAIVSGVERGWINRDDAAKRIQTLVHFLGKADRFKGAWAHWMNPDGKAATWGGKTGGDLLETSLLMQGLLVAREYFDGSSAIESEIRDSVNSFYESIEFSSFTDGKNTLYWSWYPAQNGDGEYYELPIGGYNEALIAYILALGAPKNAISSDVYQSGWYKNGSLVNNKTNYGYTTTVSDPKSKPMFLSHYSMLSMNPKMMEDQYMNYWDYSVKHALINHHYCVYEASGKGYSEGIWGLTASYGEEGYSAHSPTNDRGIISPTAAMASFPYTPYYSMQMLLNLTENHKSLYGALGFYDAFCPATDWQSYQYLAIDQGPIAVMLENYRSGLIWKLFMQIPEIQKGLQLAGIELPTYSTGFHRAIPNSVSNCYDAMMHPDIGEYQFEFYLEEAGKVSFSIVDLKLDKEILSIEAENFAQGENILSLPWSEELYTNEKLQIVLKTNSNEKTLNIILH